MYSGNINDLDMEIANKIMDGLKLPYSDSVEAALEIVNKLQHMNFKVTRHKLDQCYIASFGEYTAQDFSMAFAICKAAIKATIVYPVRPGV